MIYIAATSFLVLKFKGWAFLTPKPTNTHNLSQFHLFFDPQDYTIIIFQFPSKGTHTKFQFLSLPFGIHSQFFVFYELRILRGDLKTETCSTGGETRTEQRIFVGKLRVMSQPSTINMSFVEKFACSSDSSSCHSYTMTSLVDTPSYVSTSWPTSHAPSPRPPTRCVSHTNTHTHAPLPRSCCAFLLHFWLTAVFGLDNSF